MHLLNCDPNTYADLMLRWNPVIHVGLPHRSMADDMYEGMQIPKGATIIANATSVECIFYKANLTTML